MPTSSLIALLRDALQSFVWDEWAQMGVFTSPKRRSPWAQDPEALLVFTLEVARDEPRLYDEVLDWLLVNESLISKRRLRAMCVDKRDEAAVEAALAWLSAQRGRSAVASHKPGAVVEAEPLFRRLRIPTGTVDESFSAYGLLRPPLTASGKSRAPNPRAPINLAFRLRQILGQGARAEVVRVLLTSDAPRAGGAVVVRGAGYARPNVYEALGTLHKAGVVSVTAAGSDQRYGLDRQRWAVLLEEPPDWAPVGRSWPQLLGGLRVLLRFLLRPELETASDYLRSSLARDALQAVHADLSHAGVAVDLGAFPGDGWLALEVTIRRALEQLEASGKPRRQSLAEVEVGAPSRRRTMVMEIYEDAGSDYRWRLRAVNGHIVGESVEAYSSRRNAIDAARSIAAVQRGSHIEIDQDQHGHWRWTMRASNGELVARSSDSFASRYNAERAARRVQVAVTEAEA
jgi:uncharacterized protein YegP (UPF0339 family)